MRSAVIVIAFAIVYYYLMSFYEALDSVADYLMFAMVVMGLVYLEFELLDEER